MAVAVHVWSRPLRTAFRVGCDNVISASHSSASLRACFDFKICIAPTVFEFRCTTPPLLRHDYHSVPHRHLGVHVPADLHGWPTNALGHRQRGRWVLCQGLRLSSPARHPSCRFICRLCMSRWTDSTGCFIHIFFLLIQVRQRSSESRGDRYMLLTFEEPPANIKVPIGYLLSSVDVLLL